MQLEFTETFTKELKKLPINRSKRIKNTLRRFMDNPKASGLRLHKLNNVDAYSISSGMKDRIIMEKRPSTTQDVWRLLDVGAHDHVYRRLNRH